MKIVGIILYCLLASLKVAGQNNAPDTATKELVIRDAASNIPDLPLIMVNDKIYEGNLRDLNVNAKRIEIVKGPGADAMYGIRAARGLISIRSKPNRSSHFYKSPVDSSFDGRVVYIIDGDLSEKNYADEKGVLTRDVFGGDNLKGIQNRKLDSIVMITTKQYAIKSYEEKLIAFSEEYEQYLKKHGGGDEKLFYMINGNIYQHDKSSVEKLYNLPKDSILTVSVLTSHDFEGMTMTTIDIALKK